MLPAVCVDREEIDGAAQIFLLVKMFKYPPFRNPATLRKAINAPTRTAPCACLFLNTNEKAIARVCVCVRMCVGVRVTYMQKKLQFTIEKDVNNHVHTHACT